MPESKKWPLIAVVLVLLAGAVVFIWRDRMNIETDNQFQSADLKTPEIREVRIEEETSGYKIAVSYPTFYNLGDSARETAANNLIKGKVEKSVEEFKRNVNEETADISPDIKSEMQTSYKVVNLNPRVASIQLTETTYIEGAAHPFGLLSSFNYNFKDNREIVLADLFNPGSSYLLALSDLSRESLKNQLKEYYIQEPVEFGTAPASENFSVFFLGKDKLIIIFNVYSVAAYAAGPQTVEISYDELSSVINPEGVVQPGRQ